MDAELFWRLTPREIDICISSWSEAEQRWSMRFGTLAASTYNAQRSKRSDKILRWQDFFPPIEEPSKSLQFDSPQKIGFLFDGLVATCKQRHKNAKPSRSARQSRD